MGAGWPTSPSSRMGVRSSLVKVVEEVAAGFASSETVACKAEEEWILDRLARKRSQEEQLARSLHTESVRSEVTEDPVNSMGILRTRLVLRALGLETEGKKDVLDNRLKQAVSSGLARKFVTKARSTPPESFHCVIHRRKASNSLARVEALLCVSEAYAEYSNTNAKLSALAPTNERCIQSVGQSKVKGGSPKQENVVTSRSPSRVRGGVVRQAPAKNSTVSQARSISPPRTRVADSRMKQATLLATPAPPSTPVSKYRAITPSTASGKPPLLDVIRQTNGLGVPTLSKQPKRHVDFAVQSSTTKAREQRSGEFCRGAAAAASRVELNARNACVFNASHNVAGPTSSKVGQTPRGVGEENSAKRIPPKTPPRKAPLARSHTKTSTPPTAPTTPTTPDASSPKGDRGHQSTFSYLKASAKRTMMKFLEQADAKLAGHESPKSSGSRKSDRATDTDHAQDIRPKHRLCRDKILSKQPKLPGSDTESTEGPSASDSSRSLNSDTEGSTTSREDGAIGASHAKDAALKTPPRKKVVVLEGPQRWGPPKASPLVKSVSTPTPPTFSRPVTAECAARPPTSAVLHAPQNPMLPSTPTPTSPKQRWGPPRAAPLMAKTVSAGNSPPSVTPSQHSKEYTRSPIGGWRKLPNTPSWTKVGIVLAAASSIEAKSKLGQQGPPSTATYRTTASKVTSNHPTPTASRTAPALEVGEPLPKPYPESRTAAGLNPLLPSKLAWGVNTTIPRSAGTLPAQSDKEVLLGQLQLSGEKKSTSSSTLATRLPAVSASKASKGGPILPPPPNTPMMKVGAAGVATVPPPEVKPFKGRDIQVFYASSDEDESSEEDGEGRESDDEYHIGSDSEFSSDEDDDPILKMLEPGVIPEWAKGEAMAETMDRQYGGDKPINPNNIFVDFFTCSLEHIFDVKKKKWARKSTGDWLVDRLTIAEKLAYDRAMGYVSIDFNPTAGKKGKAPSKRGGAKQ